MSFSSTSTFGSAPVSAGSATSGSSPPNSSPPHSCSDQICPSPPAASPDYKRLERILLSLINLTRDTYSPRKRRSTTMTHARRYDQYTRVYARLTSFFGKFGGCDFVGEGTWGFVLEMGVLLRLVEVGLGVAHRAVQGMPELEKVGECEKKQGEKKAVMVVEAEERKTVERRVNTDVEWLIFKDAELDCERLPWNLDPIGADVEVQTV
ncbi:hypothetical protein P280DRAFT_515986 [Massarina eburnea CBS 473.64]|uniref:Uncharacterized protein n=1 Tax=Massarina eburnea CBS 473.64 TaxID=1395130 RepID=A0A6A6SA39_9PLEO|nr:hypothetical protein P280DRAFT_515986 [Massarina eburnea CBS 473.64]